MSGAAEDPMPAPGPKLGAWVFRHTPRAPGEDRASWLRRLHRAYDVAEQEQERRLKLPLRKGVPMEHA